MEPAADFNEEGVQVDVEETGGMLNNETMPAGRKRCGGNGTEACGLSASLRRSYPSVTAWNHHLQFFSLPVW